MMKVTKTNRGFELIEFKDTYGEICSLQESSSVEPHIWLGCNENGKFHRGEVLSPRMHLNRKQVKELMTHLRNWIRRGGFKSATKKSG